MCAVGAVAQLLLVLSAPGSCRGSTRCCWIRILLWEPEQPNTPQRLACCCETAGLPSLLQEMRGFGCCIASGPGESSYSYVTCTEVSINTPKTISRPQRNKAASIPCRP